MSLSNFSKASRYIHFCALRLRYPPSLPDKLYSVESSKEYKVLILKTNHFIISLSQKYWYEFYFDSRIAER